MKRNLPPTSPMWLTKLKTGVELVVGTTVDDKILVRTSFPKEKKKRQIPARQLLLTHNSALIICGLLMTELGVNSQQEVCDLIDKSKVILPPAHE